VNDSEVDRILQEIFDVHDRCKGHPIKSIKGAWETYQLLKQLFWAVVRE
jgi:hypothetical protein